MAMPNFGIEVGNLRQIESLQPSPLSELDDAFDNYLESIAAHVEAIGHMAATEDEEALVAEYESGIHGDEWSQEYWCRTCESFKDANHVTGLCPAQEGTNRVLGQKWCIYCEEYRSHTLETCPYIEQRTDVCTYCGEPGHNFFTCPTVSQYDGSSEKDDEEEEDSYWVDESGTYIPLDPYEPCYDEDGVRIECHCNSKRTYSCYICEVGREWPSHEWRPMREDGDYNVAKKKRRKGKGNAQRPKSKIDKQQAKTNTQLQLAGIQPVSSGVIDLSKGNPANSTSKVHPSTGTVSKYGTYSSGYSSGYSDGWGWDDYGYGSDRHYGDTYTTYDGSLTFHVSSMWNNRKETDYIPEWGLYFDWSWRPWWRAEHIDWPDYSLPERWDIALEQLIVAVEKAQEGIDVEMGCVGAHGRTGTALAAINVILGAEADEAVKHVRQKHCWHAIETPKQEWWVKWVYSQIHQTPCPAEPVYKGNYVSKGKTTVSPGVKNYPGGTVSPKAYQDCTMCEHFDQFLALDPSKPVSEKCSTSPACKYWGQDFAKFMRKEYPTWNKNNIRNKLTGTTVVEGYRVPKQSHRNKHEKSRKLGCICDVCRYIERGHGAFLRPQDPASATIWENQMEALDLEVKQAIGDRQVNRINDAIEERKNFAANVDNNVEWINVAQPDGSIMRIRIAPEFKQRPPADIGGKKPKHGERRADYVYLNDEGWVWEGLAPVDVQPVEEPEIVYNYIKAEGKILQKITNGSEHTWEPAQVDDLPETFSTIDGNEWAKRNHKLYMLKEVADNAFHWEEIGAALAEEDQPPTRFYVGSKSPLLYDNKMRRWRDASIDELPEEFTTTTQKVYRVWGGKVLLENKLTGEWDEVEFESRQSKPASKYNNEGQEPSIEVTQQGIAVYNLETCRWEKVSVSELPIEFTCVLGRNYEVRDGELWHKGTKVKISEPSTSTI